MIFHITHVFTHLETLLVEVSSGPVAQAAERSQSQLIQIYFAESNRTHLAVIASFLGSRFPSAVIVGASTVGEVAHGRSMIHQTVIGFTFFESSDISVIAADCSGGNEYSVGADMGQHINDRATDIAGVLLLSTPLSIDASALLKGLETALDDYPVFGGGAGDYAAMKNSLVFSGSEQFDKGAIAVIFSGSDLHIESKTYLGWRPLSRPMRVTQVDGLRVLRVDDQPAFDVYHRYLGLSADDHFFLNALEFPFLLEREGILLARVPVTADEQGALQFVADIHEGEVFRIGYGDIDLVTQDAREIHHSMKQFCPQAVFLYTCGCRRFLMQDAVELETRPFEDIAPTFGFYTYGEFFGSSDLTLLNSTMVAVGIREGRLEPGNPIESSHLIKAAADDQDPYANKHARIVSKLLRFIDTVTSELEASIMEVTKVSMTDSLTQLANRIRLDQVLDEQIALVIRYGIPFSIIILDVDHFKQVNDAHGHLAGDELLVRLARLLATNTRSVDVVGRWGGEEFLVIAPNTSIEGAVMLAENLRLALESTEFPLIGRKTGSFGVAGYAIGDNSVDLVARADAALYVAKNAGRNRVEVNRKP